MLGMNLAGDRCDHLQPSFTLVDQDRDGGPDQGVGNGSKRGLAERARRARASGGLRLRDYEAADVGRASTRDGCLIYRDISREAPTA